MGRQAKLRKQRAAANQKSESSQDRTGLANRRLTRQTKEKSTRSRWGQLFDRINPFSRGSDEQVEAVERLSSDYSDENLRLLGAVAWEGYQTQRRGFVLVAEVDEAPPQPTYIPRRLMRKTLREQGIGNDDISLITEYVNDYEPRKAAVLVYVYQNGEVYISTPTLKMSPPDCFESFQASEE
jgi:hypothetical protein